MKNWIYVTISSEKFPNQWKEQTNSNNPFIIYAIGQLNIICMCMCVHIDIYIYIYSHTQTHKHTHTHTHTQACKNSSLWKFQAKELPFTVAFVINTLIVKTNQKKNSANNKRQLRIWKDWLNIG